MAKEETTTKMVPLEEFTNIVASRVLSKNPDSDYGFDNVVYQAYGYANLQQERVRIGDVTFLSEDLMGDAVKYVSDRLKLPAVKLTIEEAIESFINTRE